MAAAPKKKKKRSAAKLRVDGRLPSKWMDEALPDGRPRVQVKNSTEFRIGYEITWQGAELVRVEILNVQPKRGHLWPE